MQVESSATTFLTYLQKRGVWLVFNIAMFIEILVFDANSVDPDQTPRSAVSDLGLHYLHNTLLDVSDKMS